MTLIIIIRLIMFVLHLRNMEDIDSVVGSDLLISSEGLRSKSLEYKISQTFF